MRGTLFQVMLTGSLLEDGRLGLYDVSENRTNDER